MHLLKRGVERGFLEPLHPWRSDQAELWIRGDPGFLANADKEFRQIKSLGLGDPSFDDLISMKIHDVTPEFANSMKSLGIKDLGIGELTSFGRQSFRLPQPENFSNDAVSI